MTDSVVHVGKLSQQRPRVNYANYMESATDCTWGPRIIPDCQLVYTIDGEATLTIGGERIEMTGGMGVFYGAESPHLIEVAAHTEWTFASIHFSWDQISPVPVHPNPGIVLCPASEIGRGALVYTIEVDGFGVMPFPFQFTLPHLESLFMQITREYRFAEPGYESVLRGLIVQLLTVILRHRIEEGRDTASRRKIAPALEAIRKQPDRAWTSAELARLCGYHPTYFAELFQQSVGAAPKQYVAQERIRRAKYLLIEENTVEAVAQKLGYASLHYFSRQFKQETGMSPTQFKKRSTQL